MTFFHPGELMDPRPALPTVQMRYPRACWLASVEREYTVEELLRYQALAKKPI